MIETKTVQFDSFPEPITLAYDDAGTLTVLTDQQMVGAVYLGEVNPVPDLGIAETEPIVDPDPSEIAFAQED